MGKKIRWGILGCARIARTALMPAISEARNAVLYGIAARDERRARGWAKKYRFQKSYKDYQSLLDDPEIDAVYIPLPNHLHCEWACRAARAGKHILCEKPIALNSSEVLRMIRAADEARVFLMEAFMYRFHPQIEKTLRLLDDGEIGELRFFRSAFTFMYEGNENNYRWSPEMGGGALYDVGCYPVSASRLIFGQEPVSFYARARFHPRFKVDLSTSILLEFPGSRVALLDCSFESQFQSYFEVVGTKGRITLPRSFSAKLFDVPIHILKGDKLKTVTIPSTNQYTIMVEHFGHCILKKRRPRYPADDALKNMRVIDAIFHSIRTGLPAKMKDIL